MTLYGYARVSVREPEDKNLDLQVERLVRAGCSLGNIRAEEASGARNDRGTLQSSKHASAPVWLCTVVSPMVRQLYPRS